MSRAFVFRAAAAVAFLGASFVAFTQNNGKAPALTIEKVKDDLYNIVGDGGNVAVLVTNEGVLLVDDKYEQDHDQIVDRVKSVTNQPIKYIVSTHYHADHSGGNSKFNGQALIFSTANARAGIVQKKQSNAPAGMVPANITFTQEQSIWIGGKEVRARHFGRGHTDGDAVVYFPHDRTVHTGDLMSGNTPLIDYPGGGSVVEWTKTLDAVAATWDYDTVIPGHGAVTNKAGLQAYSANVAKLRTRAQGLVRQGKSKDEVAKVMTAEFNWQPNGLQMEWSMPGIMTELK